MRIEALLPKHIPTIEKIELTAHISPWSEQIFTTSFNNRSHNFGAFIEEQLVGYYFTESVAGEATLHNICVAPDIQGQGIASHLMTHLVSYFQQLGNQEIWLDVRESNHNAIHLYEKFGFEVMGKRKDYYSIPNRKERETAILMRLLLVKEQTQ